MVAAGQTVSLSLSAEKKLKELQPWAQGPMMSHGRTVSFSHASAQPGVCGPSTVGPPPRHHCPVCSDHRPPKAVWKHSKECHSVCPQTISELQFLCCKQSPQESERTTHRMEENIYKPNLIRNLCPEHIQNAYNSTIKWQPHLLNGQRP